MKKEILIATGIFLVFFLYAWLRYVSFGPLSINDFLYVLNKAFAFSVIGIMFTAYLPLAYRKLRRSILGYAAFYFTLTHFVLSLILLPGKYYRHFHLPDGRLCFDFKMGVIFGIIAFFVLLVVYSYFKLKKKSGVNPKIFGCLTCIYYFSLLGHIYFLGYENWAKPAEWYGGLPPITLISFVLMLLFIPLGLYFIKFTHRDYLNREAQQTDTK